MTARAPVRMTAMYHAQRALGARFGEERGWRVAEVYTSVEGETAQTRSHVGLVDVSACGKLGMRGEEAPTLIARLTGQAAPAAGSAVHARLNGTAVTVCRLAPDELLTLTSAADHVPVEHQIASAVGSVGCAHATDLTSAFAAMDVLGPRTLSLLEKLVPLDLSAVKPLAVVQGELGRVRAIMLRLELLELPAFRLLVPRECGEYVWETLRDAGADLGLALIGARAHARLRGDG